MSSLLSSLLCLYRVRTKKKVFYPLPAAIHLGVCGGNWMMGEKDRNTETNKHIAIP